MHVEILFMPFSYDNLVMQFCFETRWRFGDDPINFLVLMLLLQIATAATLCLGFKTRFPYSVDVYLGL